MNRLKLALFALLALLGLRRRRPKDEEGSGSGEGSDGRIVAAGEPERGAETAVVALLLAASLCAVAFMVFYAIDRLGSQTQLMGLALGVCFALIAAALILIGKRLVVTEELEEDYPDADHPEEQAEVEQTVRESSSRFTRKRLVLGAGAVAAGTVGAAAVTPALSLGPFLDTDALLRTPWRKGVRLVDARGRPYRADDIESQDFYTAFPEGADTETIGAPVVVVRLDPASLHPPAGRSGWAPQGIIAYSKICTHAACAIALYRTPLFPPASPRPALVCPCHYSTFDPARGAKVIFGPAGRALPQLPLAIDAFGELRAGGNFSGPVGPSWWGVRSEKPT